MDNRLLFLLLLCFVKSSHQSYKPLYRFINSTLTHARNVSYHFDKNQGLSAQDKQRILDMHNTLRAYIASGNETRGYKTVRQPSAGNMQALSWDDGLADYSQAWADRGLLTHSTGGLKDPRFEYANSAENLSGDLLFVEIDMYGEVRWWNYDNFSCAPMEQCGHYIAFVTAYWIYMGCGWKFPTLVCNFAGLNTAAKEEGKVRTALQHEYRKGPPCSMCEQGFDFCMSGGLCATKDQCDSDSENDCRCLNDVNTCQSNGGTFDAVNCRCKCPADRYGINCKYKCENMAGQEEVCGMTCNALQPMEAYFCNKNCNGCGKSVSNAYKYWYEDRPPKNRDRVKSRAHWPEEVLVTPPPQGRCANQISDSVCSLVSKRNYCVTTEFKAICRRHCNSCILGGPTSPPPPAPQGGDQEFPDWFPFPNEPGSRFVDRPVKVNVTSDNERVVNLTVIYASSSSRTSILKTVLLLSLILHRLCSLVREV